MWIKWIIGTCWLLVFYCHAKPVWQLQTGFYPSSYQASGSCDQRFAVVGAQLYRRMCQQTTWSLVGTMPPQTASIFLADNVLFAYGSEVYRSQDAGQNWSKIAFPGYVRQMFQGLDQQLYATSSDGRLIRYQQDQQVWTEIVSTTNNVQTVVLADGSFVALRRMTIPDSQWQLFRSVDQGANWNAVGEPQPTHSIDNAIYPALLQATANGDIYIGGSLEFLVRLPANSSNYQYLTKPAALTQQNIGIRSLVATNDGIYLLTGSNPKQEGAGSRGVFFSADQGKNWQEVTADLTDWQKDKLEQLQITATGELYLRDPSRGIYYKANRNAQWQLLDVALPYAVSRFYRLSVNEILAVSLGGVGPGNSFGVWRSNDNGNTWQTAEHGLSETYNTLSAATQAENGDVFLSGYSNSTVFRWDRQQLRWQALPVRPTGDLGFGYTMGALTFFQQQLYAGLYFGGSWRFDRSQQSWSEEVQGLPLRNDSYPGISALAASSKGLVAVVKDQTGYVGLFRKSQANQPWLATGTALPPLASLLVSGNGRIIASGRQYLQNSWQSYNYQSLDGGASWQTLPSQIQGEVTAVTNSPDQRQTLYLTRDWLYIESSDSSFIRQYQRPATITSWGSPLFLSDSQLLVSHDKGLARLDLTQQVWNQDLKLTADLVIEDDLQILGGVIDLNGFRLTVKGHLYQPGGTLLVNGGELLVAGDYLLQPTEDKPTSNGILQMQLADDRVVVGGNFVMDSGSSHTNLLTAGVLEVQGDFSQLNQKGSYGGHSNFAASGSHVVRLTGLQPKVSFYSYWESGFQHLSVQQIEQVRFVSNYVINGQQLVWLKVTLSHAQALVSSDDQQIQCGQRCEVDVLAGTTIRLNALANAWVRFVSWSSICGTEGQCQLAMTQGTQINAEFSPQLYQVKVILPEGLQLDRTEYQLAAGEKLDITPKLMPGYRLLYQVSSNCAQGQWLLGKTYQTGAIFSHCNVELQSSKAKKRNKLPWWLYVQP